MDRLADIFSGAFFLAFADAMFGFFQDLFSNVFSIFS